MLSALLGGRVLPPVPQLPVERWVLGRQEEGARTRDGVLHSSGVGQYSGLERAGD